MDHTLKAVNQHLVRLTICSLAAGPVFSLGYCPGTHSSTPGNPYAQGSLSAPQAGPLTGVETSADMWLYTSLPAANHALFASQSGGPQGHPVRPGEGPILCPISLGGGVSPQPHQGQRRQGGCPGTRPQHVPHTHVWLSCHRSTALKL